MKIKISNYKDIKKLLFEYFITDKSNKKIKISELWDINLNEIVLFSTMSVFVLVVMWSSIGYLCNTLIPQTDIDFINSLPINNTEQKSHEPIININSAGKYELESIDGISSKLSERIVLYRYENGKFYSIYELLEIDGISQTLFDKIKNNITI